MMMAVVEEGDGRRCTVGRGGGVGTVGVESNPCRSPSMLPSLSSSSSFLMDALTRDHLLLFSLLDLASSRKGLNAPTAAFIAFDVTYAGERRNLLEKKKSVQGEKAEAGGSVTLSLSLSF